MKPTQPAGGIPDRIIHWSIALLVLIFFGFLFVMSRIWIVTAGSIRVEAELKRQLPEIVPQALPLNEEDWPDEVSLSLSETGAPSINDESASDLPKALEQLIKSAGKRKLIVTVVAHEKTPYSRVIDILDALAKAGIKDVTFTVGIEEGF